MKGYISILTHCFHNVCEHYVSMLKRENTDECNTVSTAAFVEILFQPDISV